MAKADGSSVSEEPASAATEAAAADNAQPEEVIAPAEVFATPSAGTGYDQKTGAFNF